MSWPPVQGDRILHKYLPIDGIVVTSDTIRWRSGITSVEENLQHWLSHQPYSSDDFDVAPAILFNDAPLRS